MGIIWTNVLQELSNSQPARHLRINRHGKIIPKSSFTQTSKASLSEFYIVSKVMQFDTEISVCFCLRRQMFDSKYTVCLAVVNKLR